MFMLKNANWYLLDRLLEKLKEKKKKISILFSHVTIVFFFHCKNITHKRINRHSNTNINTNAKNQKFGLSRILLYIHRMESSLAQNLASLKKSLNYWLNSPAASMQIDDYEFRNMG